MKDRPIQAPLSQNTDQEQTQKRKKEQIQSNSRTDRGNEEVKEGFCVQESKERSYPTLNTQWVSDGDTIDITLNSNNYRYRINSNKSVVLHIIWNTNKKTMIHTIPQSHHHLDKSK